jgi:membrane-associated phospholipid phosphatase
MRDLVLGVALAAPLANTSLDHDFRNWWQDDIRSSGTDDLAAFWKPFGEGAILIPALACLGLVGSALRDRPLFDVGGEFGSRATRAYLVGAPPMLFMQAMLGASRPGETALDSQWRPFYDANAVSGHAFIGAVLFITAARMTENRSARALLYLGSTCTAWSRVNDDAHYLSQAILGWYVAYLACRSVDGTERGEEPLSLVPLVCAEFSGLGLEWRR